ncbi:right-handed parallel beta-helix repeat-containing protein [Microvirga roseola]|uniref:right-handed parallel beta-helix repeat-containing protein n=1 Tax=Microvirga roseola TaxID=2883126 RepID=UPI001E2D50BE|nr:right-handed parallel beta-helix repeat-containing protein [Microvirga roseola]
MLRKSGPLKSQADGEIIENLDIDASGDHAVVITHDGVTIRNCRIRHSGGNGIHAEGGSALVLQDLDIDHVGAPEKGAGDDFNRNNINLYGCPGAVLSRIRARRGSSNIYIQASPETRLSQLELYDARGPFPRGQNVQFDNSHGSVLEDFSAENGPTSWTEDNISVYRSDRCTVRRGLVSYNNSPTGFAVMLEGSFDGLVEDVDAVQQGNGAFAAVTQGEVGSGGCRFHRCRTRDTYNSMRDGRDAPKSNSLSIYTLISEGASKHIIKDCVYYNLANPRNLIWKRDAIQPGSSFRLQNFEPHSPVRLQLPWEVT